MMGGSLRNRAQFAPSALKYAGEVSELADLRGVLAGRPQVAKRLAARWVGSRVTQHGPRAVAR